MPANSQLSSSRTCTASSRVGTITSAIGFLPWATCVSVGAEQRVGHRGAEGDRLARSGLRRHQQIAVGAAGVEHGRLDGGGRFVAARGEGGAQGGVKAEVVERH